MTGIHLKLADFSRHMELVYCLSFPRFAQHRNCWIATKRQVALPTMTHRFKGNSKRCAILAACLLLSGCAFGALPASHENDALPASANLTVGSGANMDDGEFHSSTCDGLILERQERLARMGRLEIATTNELKTLPSTIMQAVQRLGTAPEDGTAAYAELSAERARLAANQEAAKKLNCPPGPVPKLAAKAS